MEVTPERVIDEMARIAFASISDFVEVVEDGDGTAVRLIPTARVPPEKRAALASVKQSGSGVEVKLVDKWRALEALAGLTGLAPGTKERAEVSAILDDI